MQIKKSKENKQGKCHEILHKELNCPQVVSCVFQYLKRHMMNTFKGKSLNGTKFQLIIYDKSLDKNHVSATIDNVCHCH